MFAAEYKRPIPKYAGKIGVVTAQTGGCYTGYQEYFGREKPICTAYFVPGTCAGRRSSSKHSKWYTHALDRMGLDIIIVGRGGGSIEDLWAFNEEIVARAIFECNTPVISAVGHETDWTIADFVSDRRAPTPSA